MQCHKARNCPHLRLLERDRAELGGEAVGEHHSLQRHVHLNVLGHVSHQLLATSLGHGRAGAAGAAGARGQGEGSGRE
jgi:hypothetical protein